MGQDVVENIVFAVPAAIQLIDAVLGLLDRLLRGQKVRLHIIQRTAIFASIASGPQRIDRMIVANFLSTLMSGD